jgi:hypothetical protein
MLRADEMKAKAEQCEEMADRGTDRLTAHTFRELAAQWRAMAAQLEKLEHHPIYRRLSDRRDR